MKMIIYIKNVLIYVKGVTNQEMKHIIIVMNVSMAIHSLMIILSINKIVIKYANIIIILMKIMNIIVLNLIYVQLIIIK